MSRVEPPGFEKAVDTTVAGVLRRYRAREDVAERIVRETLRENPALVSALEAETDFARVERTRAFKDFQKTARKKVYYALRRYRDGDEEHGVQELEALRDDERVAAANWMRALAGSHVSTRERQGHLESFHGAIADALGDPHNILDVGSGVMPLIFEFARFPSLEAYWACDRDPVAVRILDAAARFLGVGRLHALSFEIEQGWAPVLEAAGVERFDVALLLQLVPVVKRRNPACIEILARTPARRLVVTGARQSMTRRRDVSARERRTLLDFAAAGGYSVQSEFETPGEIGLVLERGRTG